MRPTLVGNMLVQKPSWGRASLIGEVRDDFALMEMSRRM
jgi:hypothetical protein